MLLFEVFRSVYFNTFKQLGYNKLLFIGTSALTENSFSTI